MWHNTTCFTMHMSQLCKKVKQDMNSFKSFHFLSVSLFLIFLFIVFLNLFMSVNINIQVSQLQPRILQIQRPTTSPRKDPNPCLSKCLQSLTGNRTESGTTASQCSFSPIKRENHQKVAAFSFYGDMQSGYFDGIKDNLELMKAIIWLSILL